jgi:hypothetical protein
MIRLATRSEIQAQMAGKLPTFWLTVEDHAVHYHTGSKTATHDLYYADIVDVEVCRSAKKVGNRALELKNDRLGWHDDHSGLCH